MMIDNINWSTIVESRIQTVINRKAVASDERVGADILLFDVRPINQNRLPQCTFYFRCALVALSMAADLLHLSCPNVEQLFALAQEADFSHYGEIFSADWLATLANRALHNCTARVLSPLPSALELISIMTKSDEPSSAILVPYDCDKNFEPSLNGGHTAHWCLLAGFIQFRLNTTAIQRFVTAQRYRQAPSTDDDDGDLHIFAYQGKSKHAGLWSYDALRLSNANLIEPTTSDMRNYRLPIEGLAHALRSKAVLLERESIENKSISP